MNTTNGDIYSNQTYTLTAAEGYIITSYSFNGTATDGNVTITPAGESATTITSGSSLGSPLAVTVGTNSTTFALSEDGHITNLDLVVTIEEAPAFDPNNVAGKAFTMQCARGYVYWNGSAMKGHASNKTKFAIVAYDSDNDSNNETYLYDVTNKAFVCHTSLGWTSGSGNSAVESSDDFSKAVKNLSFGSTNITAYPYYLAETVYNTWLNMDGTPNVYFNTWQNFESGNGGNTYKIEIVDTNFDQTAAVAMLANYFNPSATVTYKISDASGVIFTSEALPATIGETITALPSEYQRSYCTYSAINQQIVAGPNTINVTVSSYTPPFTISTDYASATWYYMNGHASYNNRFISTNDDDIVWGTGNERTDAYKWAFFGNAYQGIKVVNKATGSTKFLQETEPLTMATTNKGWRINQQTNTSYQSGENGFGFWSEDNNKYVNTQGSTLKYWGSFDQGSTFWVEETVASDKALLKSAIDAAQALVDGAGNPGYINSTAAATLSSAIPTAQNVYDDANGDYISAYNTLTTAIATASAVENINYTPRTDVYYTIVNSRGAMVYDPSHSSSTDNGSEYLWFYDTDANHNTALTPSDVDDQENNNLWGFIEQDGKYYMYNVGKQQFATVGSGTYGATWIFSDTPAYITLDDGIADEIVAPKVRVRATIATTGQSYTMSISTSYTGPIITYDGNGDGGVPVIFTESSKAVDASVTAIMTAKVEDVTPYRNALKDAIDACALLNIGSGLNQYATNSTYTDALAAANTAYNNASATKSELQTALSDLESAIAGLTLNLPATDKFYRIKGNTSNKYLAAGLASNNKFNMTDATDATTIFYFDGTTLTNFSSGMCNGMTSNAWAWVIGANASTVVFQDGLTNGGYGIKSATCNFYDNGDGSDSADRGNNVTINSSTNARYTNWYLEEVTTLPVTISAAGYATLYAPVALTIPANVVAYKVVINEDGVHLDLTEIETTIPANTAVILEGEAGTYNFAIDGSNSDAAISSTLTGVLAPIAAPNGSYILQNQGGKVGFYLVDTEEAQPNVPAFRAYLTTSSPVKAFYFGDVETAIKSVMDGVAADEVYDLSGRKISKLQRGVNIVNGKKVMVK